jgi:hypothetical protein
MLLRIAEPGKERIAVRGAALRRAHRFDTREQRIVDSRALRRAVRQRFAPDAQRHVRHREILAQMKVDRLHARREIARSDQRKR